MREQTAMNIMYLAGLQTLRRLTEKLGWDGCHFEAARAVLERRFMPTLAVI